MHDGSVATLEQVVEFYDGGGNRNPGCDIELRPLHLSVGEKREIVAFLAKSRGDSLDRLCAETPKGRQGVYRIDPRTGARMAGGLPS